MYPILFSWGPYQLHTYAVTMALGFIAAIQFGNWRVERRGIDLQKVLNMEVLLILAGLAGARLMFVAVEFDEFRNKLWEIPLFWRGGLVYYGGFLGAIVVCLPYCRRVGLPMLACSDIGAPCVAIGQFFGRVGCLFGGCCYGAPCDLPWGMVFKHTTRDNVPRHPTQVYELLALVAIFAILNWYYERKGRPDGTVMVMYGYLYGAARFCIEFFRGDDRGDFWFGGTLSVSQVTSLAVIVAAIAAHVVLIRMNRKQRKAL